MMVGWRRAICTSVPEISNHQNPQTTTTATTVVAEKEKCNSNNPSPGLGFISGPNPSTPRLHTDLVGDSPKLRCRTTPTTPLPETTTPGEPARHSAISNNELHCNITPTNHSTKTNNIRKKSPRFFCRSTTPSSSPRSSPSTFALLKSSLRNSKGAGSSSRSSHRCGICWESVKAGQRTAIFTAECSHAFHFPCIATRVAKQQPDRLLCPVCASPWKEIPLLSAPNSAPQARRPYSSKTTPHHHHHCQPNPNPKDDVTTKKRPDLNLKVYDDDEPLLSPTSRSRFIPIPESDENDADEPQFQGFFAAATPPPHTSPHSPVPNPFQVSLSPEVAVVSAGWNCETYAAVLKVRASPPAPPRAPTDLVTVVDVGSSMGGTKLLTLKRAMSLLISSLSSADRLSIVAFSGASKRLLPLRRMTSAGRLCARRVVDGLLPGRGYAAAEAVMKAAKVLDDRRVRNPVAAIVLASHGRDDRSSPVVSCTRFPHLDIPVYAVGLGGDGACGCGRASPEEAFTECVGGLLTVAVQDTRVEVGLVSGSAPAEIPAVYSCNNGRPTVFGPGMILLGDLRAGEEREVLVELKVPTSAVGAHHVVVSVRCSHIDPFSQVLIYGKQQALPVPRPHAPAPSSGPGIERLRNLFVTTRAVAESRRLIERAEFPAAYHQLSSARALMEQSYSADEFICGLDGELAELHRCHQLQVLQRQRARATYERGEPLTPTSAWGAAERLAKVAIMRKALNRVSDLHGFEDARF